MTSLKIYSRDRQATENALSEACLRLAYYAHRYGAIPENDMVKLFGIATLGQGTEEFVAIRELAKEIREYFLSMHR